jgi:hypothetical protein
MVSYLLFADDSLLLFKANRESAVEVMECLTSTVKTLDNRNMEKSSIHFAKGVSASMRQDIKEVLGVPNEALSEKYLGMPKDVGAATNGAFKYLKDRMWNKVQGGWNKFCQLKKKRSLLRWWHKWCQPIQCLALGCQGDYASISTACSEAFGWGARLERGRRVGWLEETITPVFPKETKCITICMP